ncbi:MAG: hypothetical protein OXN89_14000 [Bryobacterales bacterium]|nr:hypothetical protein [Bryobacterales bacterium]
MEALAIDHGEAVSREADDVARDWGLERGWSHDELRTAVPAVLDSAAKTLYNSPHLVVKGASEAHILAMEVHMGKESDEHDIK